jgi:hypothetical protein
MMEVILCLYVDILIFETTLNVIEEVKDFMSDCFEMVLMMFDDGSIVSTTSLVMGNSCNYLNLEG